MDSELVFIACVYPSKVLGVRHEGVSPLPPPPEKKQTHPFCGNSETLFTMIWPCESFRQVQTINPTSEHKPRVHQCEYPKSLKYKDLCDIGETCELELCETSGDRGERGVEGLMEREGGVVRRGGRTKVSKALSLAPEPLGGPYPCESVNPCEPPERT